MYPPDENSASMHAPFDERRAAQILLALQGSSCGMCKNCLDKPRFGGRGVRKQSCVYVAAQRTRRLRTLEWERPAVAADAVRSVAASGAVHADRRPLPTDGESSGV